MVQVTAIEQPKLGRELRKPQHSFQVRQRPWQIQPFMIAPVLPGETLSNLLLQARVVTDPIKNPLIGWWAEYYFFYVKHRDLDARDTFTDMVLIPQFAMPAPLNAAANASTYHAGPGVDWVSLCLQRVVDQYFRDEDEPWNVAMLDNLPMAGVGISSWLDSVKDATTTPGLDTLPGEDDEINPELSPEFDQHFAQWQFMKANKLTEMTYDDFLKTYGIRTTKLVVDPHKPELVRYIRDWTYPSNTVDPTTGTPSSACSWAIAERADKDRFFSEPGFLFGVSVIRPKIYFSKQKGAAVSMLTDAFSWLPAVLSDDPYTSLKNFANTAGPLQGNVTNGYWVDVRDLFIYGDQFLNFSLAETDAGLVALPTATMQKRFASSADADALFTNAAGGKKLIRADGIVSLAIKGRLSDQT